MNVATPAQKKAFSVGLTGGIGCGKSTVADLFAELGASIVDTDVIAHGLSAPHGAAMPAILAEFGPDFATPDGALDRARMRTLVFSDASARARLEAIVRERGAVDPNLHYLDGRRLFGMADSARLALRDELHPDGAGHRLIGERFAKLVLGPSHAVVAYREVALD